MSKAPKPIEKLFAPIVLTTPSQKNLRPDVQSQSDEEPWKQGHEDDYEIPLGISAQNATEEPTKKMVQMFASSLARDETFRMRMFSEGFIGVVIHWNENDEWREQRYYLLNNH